LKDISDNITTEDRELLRYGARKFGVILSEKQISLLACFLEGLWLWNRRINLTGISGKKEMIIKLLLDPLVALPHLSSGGSVLDIGSGAGIPGLPLKIGRPEFEVHLLESKSKKISFLKDMIRKLGLIGIEAFKGRAEKRPIYQLYTIFTRLLRREPWHLYIKQSASAHVMLNQVGFWLPSKDQQWTKRLKIANN